MLEHESGGQPHVLVRFAQSTVCGGVAFQKAQSAWILMIEAEKIAREGRGTITSGVVSCVATRNAPLVCES